MENTIGDQPAAIGRRLVKWARDATQFKGQITKIVGANLKHLDYL